MKNLDKETVDVLKTHSKNLDQLIYDLSLFNTVNRGDFINKEVRHLIGKVKTSNNILKNIYKKI